MYLIFCFKITLSNLSNSSKQTIIQRILTIATFGKQFFETREAFWALLRNTFVMRVLLSNIYS